MPIFERNSILYLSIIIVSMTLAVAIHPLWILLWPVVLLLDDITYFMLAWSIFDSEITIQRGYQFGDWFLNNQSGAGRDLGFNLTEDYRLTSVLDSDHFGSPIIHWTPKKVGLALLAFLLDSHHLHKWLEYKTDAWMWHFGPDAFNQHFDNEYQKSLRHVTLWWLILQKNPEPIKDYSL
ncbi:MAG: hypothetical protein AAF702_16080 [Chloroflexota bacterium]